MNPKLSICCPTYNCGEIIIENLKILMPQINVNNQNIEVLISDNCSTDGSGAKLKDIIDKESWNINLNINPSNIGVEANIKNVISQAKGEYIYLLGDDLVCPNFVEIILPLLNEDRFSIIHFNRLSGNHQWTDNSLYDREFKGLIKDLNFEDFVKYVLDGPSFISSMIFKKSIWEKGQSMKLANRYYGFNFLANIFFASKGTNCLYYYMPIIIQRCVWPSWSKDIFKYIYLGLSNLFNDLDNDIPGVKEKWAKHIRNKGDLHKGLSDLALYRNYYKQLKKEILNICINKKERITVKLLLTFPGNKKTAFLYLSCLRIYRLLTGKYQFLRKIDYKH